VLTRCMLRCTCLAFVRQTRHATQLLWFGDCCCAHARWCMPWGASTMQITTSASAVAAQCTPATRTQTDTIPTTCCLCIARARTSYVPDHHPLMHSVDGALPPSSHCHRVVLLKDAVHLCTWPTHASLCSSDDLHHAVAFAPAFLIQLECIFQQLK
jgi:hypothetical protein